MLIAVLPEDADVDGGDDDDDDVVVVASKMTVQRARPALHTARLGCHKKVPWCQAFHKYTVGDAFVCALHFDAQNDCGSYPGVRLRFCPIQLDSIYSKSMSLSRTSDLHICHSRCLPTRFRHLVSGLPARPHPSLRVAARSAGDRRVAVVHEHRV